jgi:hypothetical protein
MLEAKVGNRKQDRRCTCESDIEAHSPEQRCHVKAVKVKVFRYKPDVALGVPGGKGSWIFWTFGTMKLVRSSALRTGLLHPQEFSWYSFLEAESSHRISLLLYLLV